MRSVLSEVLGIMEELEGLEEAGIGDYLRKTFVGPSGTAAPTKQELEVENIKRGQNRAQMGSRVAAGVGTNQDKSQLELLRQKSAQKAYDKKTNTKNSAIAMAAGGAAGAAGGALGAKLAVGKKIATLRAQAAAEKDPAKVAAINKRIARLKFIGKAMTAGGAIAGGAGAEAARRNLNVGRGMRHIASKLGEKGAIGAAIKNRSLAGVRAAFKK